MSNNNIKEEVKAFLVEIEEAVLHTDSEPTKELLYAMHDALTENYKAYSKGLITDEQLNTIIQFEKLLYTELTKFND